MRRITAILLLAACVVGFWVPGVKSAQAYSLGYGRFNNATGYWTYGPLWNSSWNSAASGGAYQWTAVTDCPFTYSYNIALGNLYGNNIQALNLGATGKVGVTVYSYSTSMGIYNMKIKVNTYYPMATDGRSTAYDVQSILTHEFGHGVPLNDITNYYYATMYAYTQKGETWKRTLYSDDIAGVRAAY